MPVFSDYEADRKERERQAAIEANTYYKEKMHSAQMSIDQDLLDSTAKAGGIYVPPPPAMPLPPEMTVGLDRQAAARRQARRRGRESTFLSGNGLGSGGDVLG